jgi:hypothetical protein
MKHYTVINTIVNEIIEYLAYYQPRIDDVFRQVFHTDIVNRT